MSIDILGKVILFWCIFYITPGPVWVSVMEAVRTKSWHHALRLFFRVFLPADLVIQVPQTIICFLFVEFISKIFSDIGFLLYLGGASYILYLAIKVFKSKQSNVSFNLTFADLALVMFLSPKIWLLFPAGAIIAGELSSNIFLNMTVFTMLKFLINGCCFFLYVFIGKMATKAFKDNFAYISFGLLILFSAFLYFEAASFFV